MAASQQGTKGAEEQERAREGNKCVYSLRSLPSIIMSISRLEEVDWRTSIWAVYANPLRAISAILGVCIHAIEGGTQKCHIAIGWRSGCG